MKSERHFPDALAEPGADAGDIDRWRPVRRLGTVPITDLAVILAVGADDAMLAALAADLPEEGFEVLVAREGAEALGLLVSRPDAVLLNMAVPGSSGIDLCRRIRRRSGVPVILLSGTYDASDAVAGLDAGADDYIVYPHRWRELVARIRAALRRSPRAGAGGRAEAVEVGDVVLDPISHEVTVDGKVVSLPLREFELLEVFLGSAGKVWSREVLMVRVWGRIPPSGTKTLDVHVKRLRAKIEATPSAPTRILTVRGVGYRYAPPGERPS